MFLVYSETDMLCCLGFGGQLDFIRGAGEGFDGKGKPIIALQSINPKTKDSKIVPIIKPGTLFITN